jgi:hypothetical protein
MNLMRLLWEWKASALESDYRLLGDWALRIGA